MTRLRRLLGATALLLALAPATAPAASSTVTVPAAGTLVVGSSGAPGTLATVAGTASGTAAVDIHCAWRDGSTLVITSTLQGGFNVPVTGGAFSVSNVVLPTNVWQCRLVALPDGQASPTDLAGFDGPSLRVLQLLTGGSALTDNHGGSNQGKEYDFVASAVAPAADASISMAAGEAIYATHLVNAIPGDDAHIFDRADAIAPTDPATGGAPDATSTGITVDGGNAYLGASWEDQITPTVSIPFGSLTPFPAVSAVAQSGADGSYVVTEHDIVVQCATGLDTNYYPPAGATCTSLKDAGVVLDLTTTVSPSGNVVTRAWRWTSTDGQPHTVHLVVLARAAGNGNGHGRSWRLPGDAGYVAHTNGDTPAPVAKAPWTARFHSDGAADGDVGEGVGAVTFGNQPDTLRYTDPNTLAAGSTFVVPGSGHADRTATYMSEPTQAALEADIAAAEGPVPAGGGGGGGDAPGDSGPAAPGPGPGPGAPAAPAPGVLPHPSATKAALPAAPTLARTGKPKLKGALLSLGYKLGCPGTGATCTATIVVAPRPAKKSKKHHAPPKPLLRATAWATARHTAALTLKVPKATRAKLTHGTLTLTITLKRAPRAAKVVAKTLTVPR
ncbi:MAG TPA: hypothetical protein VGM33_14250 [Baekduia sp.]